MNIDELIEKIPTFKNRTDQVRIISEYILAKNAAESKENAISGSKVYDEYENIDRNTYPLPEIPKNTFNIYLSKIANSPQSKINCQGNKQGYYIDNLFEIIEKSVEDDKKTEQESQQEKTNEFAAKSKGNLLEKDLYPYLVEWLLKEDNERVADISQNRSQGKWGNPDLVGLKIEHLLGSTEIEITTIEAKLTIENWEQWIFEAVAHTIFSSRSYFAFIHSEQHINKITSDLKHYAETFNVGILIIAVDAADYIKIQKREQFQLTEENQKILTYSPAPYTGSHIKFKKKFLSGLDIREQKDLYRFGKTLER